MSICFTCPVHTPTCHCEGECIATYPDEYATNRANEQRNLSLSEATGINISAVDKMKKRANVR